MSATELQAFLRFLSQDAKLPLASAISKIKELQNANLDSPEKLAKVKMDEVKAIFPDEKVAKQILTAAKRVSKKRAAGDDTSSSPRKKRKESLFAEDPVSPADVEASVGLPHTTANEDELSETVVFTNRAPLVLAFVVTLLKHTMPEQPISSRLSLAQGYVSVTSRARAVNLGLESGKSAEEEGFGEGQPFVAIMGKEIRVLRRWGYEWRDAQADVGAEQSEVQASLDAVKSNETSNTQPEGDEQPPLWALDLEALKKSNNNEAIVANVQSGNNSGLPIYTPQSARAYMLKSFDSVSSADGKSGGPTQKLSVAARTAEKERNLGKLLRVLDMLYESWAITLTPEELDKRTWAWYVKVRPNVEQGVAGWGGKNEVKLADLLRMRREN